MTVDARAMMVRGFLDLNADVGEGFPHDETLIQVISSANIACGFHAGDLATMRWLCELCADREVAVGAQVSYRDREGFGRRPVEIGYDDLLADLIEQRASLEEIAVAAGARVGYLKPHGALYHRAGWDLDQARAVVDAAAGLPVLGLPGSILLEQATEAGLRAVREFFADRGYTAAGTLVPRSEPGALVSSPMEVADRTSQLVESATVTAVDGGLVSVIAESICVHGDTHDAVGVASAVVQALTAHGVRVASFVAGRPG